MPMSEIEALLQHNQEFIRIRDEMMEKQRQKAEQESRNGNRKGRTTKEPIYY
nr:MAG TPA: hypothetical protein [Caudoviricetes sp.]